MLAQHYFKCLECHSEKNLDRHFNQELCLAPKFICTSCGKSLGGKIELNMNIALKLMTLKTSSNTLAGSPESHVRYNYTKDRDFICKFCIKKFPFASFKEAHKKGAHSQPNLSSYVSCGKCGEKFKSLQNLKSHNMLHTGEKPYKCTF